MRNQPPAANPASEETKPTRKRVTSHAQAKTVPSSKESEMMVLGCMLTNVYALNYAADHLSQQDFFYFEHKTVFNSLKRLRREGRNADVHIVCEELKSQSNLEKIGGVAFITGLAQYAGTSAYVEEYCSMLKKQSHCRQALELLLDAQHEFLKAPEDPAAVSEVFHKRFSELGKEYSLTEKRSLGEIISGNNSRIEPPRLIDQIQTRYDYHQEHGQPFLSGVPTGFRDLDARVSLLEDTHFIVLAGRPAMGKTALGLTIASHVCLEQNHPVGFISLEMSADQLAERILSIRTKISGEAIKRGTLSATELQKLRQEEPKLQKAPFFIDDSVASSVQQVMSRARKLKDEEGIKLLMVDYLQLLGTGGRADSRQYEVAEVSRSLKKLAMELKIPVVCIAQLSRKVEERLSKKPMMADLRDSGQIEQDADSILFVYRPSYYDPSDKPGQAEIIVAKNRHGPTTNIPLAFQSECGLFSDLASLPHTAASQW